MTRCTACNRPLALTDQIHATGSGRLDPRGAVRCSPCYHRVIFPTPEKPDWVVKSLSVAFRALTLAQRRRITAYLKSAGARLGVGPDFFGRYWVYEGIPRIEVVASGPVPRVRTIQDPDPSWVTLSVRMEEATHDAAEPAPLSYHVARQDATLAQVRAALRIRAPRLIPADPLDGLFN